MDILKDSVTYAHSKQVDSEGMKGSQELILTEEPMIMSPVLPFLGHIFI